MLTELKNLAHKEFNSLEDVDIIERNNKLINYFREKFKETKSPIEVNFREIIPELKSGDRFTHSIHSYPAKLLVHIPYFFLNNTEFSKPKSTVLDPFNGTGTVYLEALLAGRKVYGADSNPLAKLIAKVKSTRYDTTILDKTLMKIISNAQISEDKSITDVVNCDLWFPQNTKNDLSRLLFQIKKIESIDIRDFMLICFSNCVKKVSYADPRISVPVKLNPERYINDIELKKKIEKKS